MERKKGDKSCEKELKEVKEEGKCKEEKFLKNYGKQNANKLI